MASLRRPAHAPLTLRPLTFGLLLLLAAAMLMVACDDAEGQGSDGSPTPGGGTATAIPGGGSDGGDSGSNGGSGSGSSASSGEGYDSALQMALDEDMGSDVDPAYLASIDIDVKPNGEGLPDGSGIAERGAQVYAEQCASCHGDNGEGGGPAGDGPQVIIAPEDATDGWQTGEPKVIGNYWPYATTVWDFINRAMPFLTPGTLSPDDVYAVTAYLLAENGVIDADEEMNQDTLAQVEMPNRDNFFSCWPDECRPDVDGGEADQPSGDGNGSGGASSPTPTGTVPEDYDTDNGTATPGAGGQ